MAKAAAQPPSIFDKNDYRNLIEARTILNNLITTCDKAQQCGNDVSIWRQQMADIDRQLSNIHSLFMTPAPTN